jgi:NAD(P)H-dependent flavin oxidoreductase YrpB (nitropropane dioxygenase family)
MRTKACDLLGMSHPLALAPMGGSTDAALVSAVSGAGGLGMLGATWIDTNLIAAELAAIRQRTNAPFAASFVLPFADPAAIHLCLDAQIPILSTFRGDPIPLIAEAKSRGIRTIHQATTLAEVAAVAAAGVDVIIAQGNEAGGHGGPEPLWSFLPDAIQAAGEVPVMAAGGIVDGRGLAAVLALGASGAVMGTRFLASVEAPVPEAWKQAILAARPGDTLWSPVWDQVYNEEWPGVQVRAIRNDALLRWHGRPEALAAQQAEALAALHAAKTHGQAAEMDLMAGVGSSRIHEILPAANIVAQVMAEAREVLQHLGRAAKQP